MAVKNITGVTSISAGSFHTCAVATMGGYSNGDSPFPCFFCITSLTLLCRHCSCRRHISRGIAHETVELARFPFLAEPVCSPRLPFTCMTLCAVRARRALLLGVQQRRFVHLRMTPVPTRQGRARLSLPLHTRFVCLPSPPPLCVCFPACFRSTRSRLRERDNLRVHRLWSHPTTKHTSHGRRVTSKLLLIAPHSHPPVT